jgi:hypothetical protein
MATVVFTAPKVTRKTGTGPVLRVTLGAVKTTVAILPVAIFGYKFINEMMNEVEKVSEMSAQDIIRD